MSKYPPTPTWAALAAVTLTLTLPGLAVAKPDPPTLDLVARPYYAPGYHVGLTASWESVAKAESYRVTHFRQDACGSASVEEITTGTASGSGLHRNCGAPASCYFRQVTVDALDRFGNLLVSAEDSFCEVGYLEEPSPDELVPLDDMPFNLPNVRFFDDLFVRMRPALTFRGFDCAVGLPVPGGCDYGLGIRQVLERVYHQPDSLIVEDFRAVVTTAAGSLANPGSNRGQVERNTDILQSKAFVALVTYVLEQNCERDALCNPAVPPYRDPDRDEAEYSLPPHDLVMEQLVEGLLEPPPWQYVGLEHDCDGVKWVRSVTQMARTIDLYLAIENAYEFFGGPEERLLKFGEKRRVLTRLVNSGIFKLDLHLRPDLRGYADYIGGCFVDPLLVDAILAFIDAIPFTDILLSTPVEETQPGNWPMKLQAAKGYASLTMQDIGRTLEVTLEEAFRSLAAQASQDRTKHWSYQSGNGQRYWAESPFYLHFSLREVVPFWHAVRSNDLLGFTGDPVPDPFRSPWFLNPVDWLADLTTPDGRLPPLDDGNKFPMTSAATLRWSSEYANGDPLGTLVGRKFAWIDEQLSLAESANRLVAMAIPRATVAEMVEPEEIVGDDNLPGPVQAADEQQIVVRQVDEDGRRHYVLLAGEHGDAITRGEGHEQPDAMQLLYYVGDQSYLMDSGYDLGGPFSNSTWNHWGDHNVMLGFAPQPPFVRDGEFGSFPPSLFAMAARKITRNQPVRTLYVDPESAPRVVALRTEMDLEAFNVGSFLEPFAHVARTVLVVQDPASPYLVDVNAARRDVSTVPVEAAFAMLYHGNSNDVLGVFSGDGTLRAYWWRSLLATGQPEQPTANDLFIQPFSIEHPLKIRLQDETAREPNFGDAPPGTGHEIQKARISSGPPSTFATFAHTTAAFIEAMPDAPPYPPRLAKAHPEGGDPEAILTWRYFTRERGADVLDVLAVRSAIVEIDPGLRRDEVLSVAEAGDFELLFEAVDDYGFARLVRQGGSWTLDEDYRVNLVALSSPPSTTYTCSVDITGGTDTCDDGIVTVTGDAGDQRVLRVDLDEQQPWQSLHAMVHLCDPTGWSMHFADSPSANGFGGDAGTTRHDAEAQMNRTTGAVYRSDLGGSTLECVQSGAMPASGCFWVQWTIGEDSVAFDVGEDTCDAPTFTCTSSFLFDLPPYDEADAEDPAGADADKWYVGLNRTVGSFSRAGSGVREACFVLSTDAAPSCSTVASECGF